MKSAPVVRSPGGNASRSPNKSPGVLPSDVAKSIRANNKIMKKIADAVDLLQKKQVLRERTEDDQGNMEIYDLILHEKLTIKNVKFEKPSKKVLEAKKTEITGMKEELERLAKELELRKEMLEKVKSFLGQLVRDLIKYVRGYQDPNIERERPDVSRKVLNGTAPVPKFDLFRKSKSINELAKTLPMVNKAVHFLKNQKSLPEKKPVNPEDVVKIWTDKRRSSMFPRKSKLPMAIPGDGPIIVNEAPDGQVIKPSGCLSAALTQDTDDFKARASTQRFQITVNDLIHTQNGLLNKGNIRKSVMNLGENVVNLRDYEKLKNSTNKKSHLEIMDMLQSQAKNQVPMAEGDEETGSKADSNLSDSIVEEVREDLKMKLIKKNYVEYNEQNAFDYKVVVPNFQPVKVSFKVEIQGQRLAPEKQLVVMKDRIFKNFAIYEIEWHFRNKGLCGLRMILKNWDTGFLLGGAFHGKIGDYVDLCRFNRDEKIIKIEYAHDHTAMRFLEFFTSENRRFLVGIDRKEATGMGLTFVNRYYPQEIMLCKFFAQFNKMTQYIDYIRFLFIRAVLY